MQEGILFALIIILTEHTKTFTILSCFFNPINPSLHSPTSNKKESSSALNRNLILYKALSIILDLLSAPQNSLENYLL